METSKALKKGFLDSELKKTEGADLEDIKVLDSSNWQSIRSNQGFSLTYPTRLNRLKEQFTDYYAKSNNAKKLTFLN